MNAFDCLKGHWRARAAVLLAIAVLPGINRASAVPPPQATVPVQITVTLLPQGADYVPAISMDNVQVSEGRDREPVTSWLPAQGPQAGLQLLILIDDSDRWSLSDQFDALRAFIMEQPPTTAIGLAYMSSGLMDMAQSFTVDHDAVAKALRPPLGRALAGSAYFSLVDMYKRRLWRTSRQYPRRAILLMSDGNDPYAANSGTDDDAYVDEAVSDVQISGIQIFGLCIPYGGAQGGYRGGALLEQVSEATGGVALYTGMLGTPFFKPLLAQFNTMLKDQYLLTFDARPKTANTLRSVKVKINARKVKFAAPDAVFVPGTEN